MSPEEVQGPIRPWLWLRWRQREGRVPVSLVPSGNNGYVTEEVGRADKLSIQIEKRETGYGVGSGIPLTRSSSVRESIETVGLSHEYQTGKISGKAKETWSCFDGCQTEKKQNDQKTVEKSSWRLNLKMYQIQIKKPF